MNKILIPLGFLFVFLILSDVQAQRRWRNEPGERQNPEQLDKYRKMRLIEVMNLEEEDAIRFTAKEDAHREKMRAIMLERNRALDDLDQLIDGEKEQAEIEKGIEQVRDIDKRLNAERERYHDELKSFLTTRQFARFLIFERNFGKRLRDAFNELHKGTRQKSKD